MEDKELDEYFLEDDSLQKRVKSYLLFSILFVTLALLLNFSSTVLKPKGKMALELAYDLSQLVFAVLPYFFIDKAEYLSAKSSVLSVKLKWLDKVLPILKYSSILCALWIIYCYIF